MDKDQTKRNSTGKKNKPTTSPSGGSAHKDQLTGNFTTDVMVACIKEIRRAEAKAAVDSSETLPLPSPHSDEELSL